MCQENEEKASSCQPTSTGHSPSSILSPPSVPEEPQHEVIGAGLPLLQRLLLLKAKEDRATAQSSQTPSPVVSPKPTTNKVSFKDRFSMELITKKEPPPPVTAIPPPPTIISSPPPKTCSPVPEQAETSSPGSPLIEALSDEEPQCQVKESEQVSIEVMTPSDETCPWTKLKQATVVAGAASGSMEASETDSAAQLNKKSNKPSMLLFEGRTKHYESIDDLSPEYCGLPFVKKLKILNERQKLAELEHVMKARSVSLDIPCDTPGDSTITRSKSEGSSMHSCNTLDVALNNDPPTSPESNETLGKIVLYILPRLINTTV